MSFDIAFAPGGPATKSSMAQRELVEFMKRCCLICVKDIRTNKKFVMFVDYTVDF